MSNQNNNSGDNKPVVKPAQESSPFPPVPKESLTTHKKSETTVKEVRKR